MPVGPGQQLAHYRLIERIGEGGMGVVWKALDTRLDREVAIKILPDAFARDPDKLGRFEREAKAVAALNHPNIVTIYSVEQSEDLRFITMELVQGRSLDLTVPKGGLKLERFFEIAIPLAAALSAAHERGITHRDLKPANVMVDDEGRVKILDFGLAKLMEQRAGPESADLRTQTRTGEGTILGTLAYMSPEQLQAQPVDHRTDIFSLGVTLYEMATGLRPFRGENSAALISSVLGVARLWPLTHSPPTSRTPQRSGSRSTSAQRPSTVTANSSGCGYPW